jgi:hypothetical protein
MSKGSIRGKKSEALKKAQRKRERRRRFRKRKFIKVRLIVAYTIFPLCK